MFEWGSNFVKTNQLQRMRSYFSTGGCDATLKAANESDLLQNLKRETSYDYDIMVMPSRDPLWALLTCSVTLGFFLIMVAFGG